MSDTVKTLAAIENSKLIAISRGLYGDELLKASLALYEGGVRAFEAAFVQSLPNEVTAECIRLLIKGLPSDAAVGAGTVMDTAQAEAAERAGAAFVISPNTDAAVIARTKSLGMVSVPGALTPTEIAAAFSFGADIVKVFPAGTMGIEYFKQIKAPLSHIPLAAVGGLSFENVRGFYEAGAVAFGISGSLYNKDSIRRGKYAELTSAARRYYEILS